MRLNLESTPQPANFRTITDFRQRHARQIEKVFLAFVRACREMMLMDAGTICLDGTTIRASNDRKQSISVEMSQKKLGFVKS